MTFRAEALFNKYLRKDRFPSIFCQGCGVGNIIFFTARALYELRIDPKDVALFSGIGCCGRVPGYWKVDGLHCTHGRALAFATGAKLADPELNIIVFSGDGDTGAIGGNHFIHTCRRNIDMTLIVVNNFIYGMTGGQVAPTTPLGEKSTTTPYGNLESPFDLPLLAASSGASYAARWTVAHPDECIKSLKDGIQNKGFSYIEILSPCPPNYGRRNRKSLEDLHEMYRNLESVTPSSTKEYEDAKRRSEYGLVLGVFKKEEVPELTDQIRKQQLPTPRTG